MTPHPQPTDLTGLLLIANRLQQTGRPLGRSSIVPFAELKLPRVAQDYDMLIDRMQKNDLIAGSAEEFSLTPAGLAALQTAAKEYSLHALFYNEYYQAITHSQAHSLLCERAYGKDLGQHGMADMEQIHILLAELQVDAGMSLLDFGCGDGQISEYIAEATHTRVTGVDIAFQAIEQAQARTIHKRDRLQFHWADLEKNQGDFPPGTFDRIFAIDSLFFAQDQQTMTQRLLDHLAPNGALGVFYLCHPEVLSTETPLAKALHNLAIPHRTCDLSSLNRKHWKKKKQVLLELEPLFQQEGNNFLFKNRLAECDGLENFHRYLYLVTS